LERHATRPSAAGSSVALGSGGERLLESITRRDHLRRLLGLAGAALTFPGLAHSLAGCIGSNADEPAVDYPDLGRTTVDPLLAHKLSLTFDDGPSAAYTRDIVDTLDKYGVKAAFFCMGKSILGNRELLDYEQQRGHQVCNHSFYHEPQPSLSEAVFKHRLRAVKENIGDSDQSRLLFRFPYGAAGREQLRYLREVTFDGKSYVTVGWHIDSQDWEFGSGYPETSSSTSILQDSDQCGGMANPFQQDYVGWCQFIARKKTGGVMLFHDIQQITRDRLGEIITGLIDPKKHWDSLTPNVRKTYDSYYNCAGVDPLYALELVPLTGGTWPSYV
jgi:peptidoglycan/xylan/chitin deacetylase (PgdA/CDA1 family)